MANNINIQQQDDPSEDELAYVRSRFRAFNDQQSGVFPSKDLHLFAYAPDQQIIGGLFGDISWGWLHVETLWVDDRYRQDGVGTALMDRAEIEAIAMGVKRTYLETTDFQARGFYEKCGYHAFAHLDDQPPGHTCYYMRKIIPSE